MIKRALISVSDKTGIVEFARELEGLGFEIVSTGGTYKKLLESGIAAINISDVTGFPECLDGRVKTLHPKVHAGILAIRGNAEHMAKLEELDIKTIDVVVINLYPFKEVIQKEGTTLEEAIENIDIGGPTMLRAAAKNYEDVTVIVNPMDYDIVLEEMKAFGGTSHETKYRLAVEVFSHTAHYDALIADYLCKKIETDKLPDVMTLTYEKILSMRYGENPHQKAAFYRDCKMTKGNITDAQKLHGKELSYNNINDANAAIELLKEFDEPTVVAVKHANPCGVASSENIFEAYKKAYEADSVSIFGGIIAANREIDELTAIEINKIFVEIVIAPKFTQKAFEILSQKKNIRILSIADNNHGTSENPLEVKSVAGGLLVQEKDSCVMNSADIKYVTKLTPSEAQMKDLIFAMKVVKHTKSNAIVLVKDKMTIGIGPGQTNRITALNIAVEYAKDRNVGAVMASDAFFPFPDCVEAAQKAGVNAIIQPGGSVKDSESIEACDNFGIAMVFTGVRHFKH